MSDGARKQTKSTFHFVAGLGSGILSAVLLQPIDLLKTRVQQSGHHSLVLALREIRNGPAGGSGAKPGLVGLWRGTVPSALRTGFGSAIYFTGLNAIRTQASRVPFLAVKTPTEAAVLGSGNGNNHSSSLVRLSNTGNLLAGGTARAFAGMILMPLTVIKVRYESNLYNYSSLAGASRDILRTEGLRGFFSGFGATAVRDAPYAALYVLFYEQCKRRLSALYGSDSSAPSTAMGVPRAAAINFSSGAIAAVTCSVVSNPFDAVKTRIQLQPARYRNMWHAARRMLAEEGVRSMWDGLALRMSRKALSSALAWTVYEELIRRAQGVLTSTPGKKERVL